jgi:hypothetical protein
LPGARARPRLLSIAATNAAELKRAADQLGSRLMRAKAAASGSPSITPTLVKAAIDGRLPRGLGVKRLPRGYGLKRLIDLPSAWPDQWRTLGLKAPARAS